MPSCIPTFEVLEAHFGVGIMDFEVLEYARAHAIQPVSFSSLSEGSTVGYLFSTWWRPHVAVREIYIRAPWGGRVGYSVSARGDRALNTLPGLADEESRVLLTHEALVQLPTHPGDKCVVGREISSHIQSLGNHDDF